jgi:hypothetical protein
MIAERIGEVLARPFGFVVRAFAHISPDVLTITGLILNGVACAFFAFSGGKDYRELGLLQAGGDWWPHLRHVDAGRRPRAAGAPGSAPS